MCYKINMFLACSKQSQKPWKLVLYLYKRKECHLKIFNFGLFSVSRDRIIIVLLVLFA